VAIDVEKAIQDAQREGRFSNLPGQGKPLQIDPSPDAVVNNLLKEANVRPEWIEIGCRIDALQEQTARYLDQWGRQYQNDRQKLAMRDEKVHSLTGWRRWWHILWHGSANRLQSQAHNDSFASFNRRRESSMARYTALLNETNKQIRRFNYLVPQRELQRNVRPVRELLDEFTSQFPPITSESV
jgi:hypothetical protein